MGRISTLPQRPLGMREAICDGLVKVFHINQKIAAELFACLRERAVGDEGLAVFPAHGGGREGGL